MRGVESLGYASLVSFSVWDTFTIPSRFSKPEDHMFANRVLSRVRKGAWERGNTLYDLIPEQDNQISVKTMLLPKHRVLVQPTK